MVRLPGGQHMIRREDTSKTLPVTSNDRPSTVIESDLRMRLRTFPRDAQTWFKLGSYLRSIQRLEEAEEALRKAISLNPGPTHFHQELGLILMALGRLDEAYRFLDNRKTDTTDSTSAEIGTLREIESAIEVEADVISPCVECSDYSYYGCSKGASCELVLAWRAKIRQQAMMKTNR
jgi:tetratricopeptide (TPR) repeat protein